MKFERSALAVAVFMAAGVVIAATRYPADDSTGIPRAVLDVPESLVRVSAIVEHRPIEGAESLLDPESVSSADALSNAFDQLGYDFDKIIRRSGRVPRILLASLPPDLGDVREVKVRKTIFLRTVLPLVLQVNEELLAERRRIWRVRFDRTMSGRVKPEDDLWLAVMADKYKTRRGDLDALLRRIDIIPPSLALAQAAEESGWGTSRFTREGNAIFGQWTFSKESGIVPIGRDEGKDHRVRAFDSLLDSVRAYARNLNSHKAYGEFRQQRAAMRTTGQPIDGYRLAGALTRYSERGNEYIQSIRAHIRVNNLIFLDDARLHETVAFRRLI